MIQTVQTLFNVDTVPLSIHYDFAAFISQFTLTPLPRLWQKQVWVKSGWLIQSQRTLQSRCRLFTICKCPQINFSKRLFSVHPVVGFMSGFPPSWRTERDKEEERRGGGRREQDQDWGLQWQSVRERANASGSGTADRKEERAGRQKRRRWRRSSCEGSGRAFIFYSRDGWVLDIIPQLLKLSFLPTFLSKEASNITVALVILERVTDTIQHTSF